MSTFVGKALTASGCCSAVLPAKNTVAFTAFAFRTDERSLHHAEAFEEYAMLKESIILSALFGFVGSMNVGMTRIMPSAMMAAVEIVAAWSNLRRITFG